MSYFYFFNLFLKHFAFTFINNIKRWLVFDENKSRHTDWLVYWSPAHLDNIDLESSFLHKFCRQIYKWTPTSLVCWTRNIILSVFRRVDVTQSTTAVAEAGGETILKCTSASTSRVSNNNSSLSSDTSLSNKSCSWELNGKKIQQNSSRHSFGFDESQVWLVTLPSQQTVSNCPSRSVNWGYIQFWRATLVNMLVNMVNLISKQVSSKWWVFTWQWCHPYNFTMVLGESAWAAAY